MKSGFATRLGCGVLAAAIGLALAAERNRALERLNRLSRSLNRAAADKELTPEARWMLDQAAQLLQRAHSAQQDEYLFSQLCEAVDDALDAVEQLREAWEARGKTSAKVENQREAARELERAYFAIQQSEYFTKQLKGKTSEFLQLARRLYQAARSAYDNREYQRAEQLAEAVREIAAVIENLAQAEIRLPKPPAL